MAAGLAQQGAVPADPLGPIAARAGLWLADEVTELPDGTRFLDGKRYARAANDRAVTLENLRLFADGAIRSYLTGLYAFDGEAETVVHMAAFDNGGLVRDATLSELDDGRHRLSFAFVMPDGTTSRWRSTEWIDAEGRLVEQAERLGGDGAWRDMGTTRYRRAETPADPAAGVELFESLTGG